MGPYDTTSQAISANKRDALVVFGEDWHGLPSSTQHLIKPLCNQYDVIWINSIGLRQPRINLQDTKRIIQKLCQLTHKKVNNPQVYGPQSTQAEPKIILNLKTIPAPKSHFTRTVCGKAMAKNIKQALESLNCSKPIIWASLPTAIDAIKYLEHKAVIYYCCDDFKSLAGVDHKTIAKHEEELLNSANLVIASQFELAKSLSHRIIKSSSAQSRICANKKTPHILPHGVDYDRFSESTTVAQDYPTNNRPTAGFYGSIASWLDFDLLNHVIDQNSQWNFVFIGNIEASIKNQAMVLSLKSNTYFLGPKSHHLLPHYSQHWQASLLPFKQCPQIHNCNPLKLREYLAAGSPIISTNFPAVQEYKELINIAHNTQEFNQHLNTIAKLDNKQKNTLKCLQQESVKNHSWQARSLQLNQWIETL